MLYAVTDHYLYTYLFTYPSLDYFFLDGVEVCSTRFSPARISYHQIITSLNQVFLLANHITTYLLGTSYKLEKKNFTQNFPTLQSCLLEKLPTYLGTIVLLFRSIPTLIPTCFLQHKHLDREQIFQKKNVNTLLFLFTIGEEKEKKKNSARLEVVLTRNHLTYLTENCCAEVYLPTYLTIGVHCTV